MKCLSIFASVLALGLVVSPSAKATTAGLDDGFLTIGTNLTLPAFTGMLTAPNSNSAAFRLNFVGNDLVDGVAPNSRSPWDTTAFQNTAFYNSVERNGFAEYNFNTTQFSFGLMWGSPDTYNTLSFFLNGVLQYSTTGDEFTPPAPPQRGFVNVDFSGFRQGFDTVRFESGFDAFEYSNVLPATVIPLPTPALLLLTALGGLAYLGRRRRVAA